MSGKEPAQALNALLMELEDGRKGYALAAEESPPALKPLLSECAHDCTRAMHDLQKSVQTMGEVSVEHGSATGTLRHGWSRLKAAVSPDSGHGALQQVEEEYARIESAFREALAADLTQPERSVVVKELARVRHIPGRLAQVRRLYAPA
jgi:uncharacterized protein (TIGR02284 family)